MKTADLDILLREGEGVMLEYEGAIRFDTSVCPKFRYPQDFDREKSYMKNC